MSTDLKFDLPNQTKQTSFGQWALTLLLMCVGIGFTVFAALSVSLSSSQPGTARTTLPAASLLSHDELTTLAESLERNQLYVQAARAWEQAAALSPPEGAERTKMLFRIGKNLVLGNAHDEGLRYLLAAESLDNTKTFETSINRLVLESLSALGLEDARAYQAGKRIAMTAGDADDSTKPLATIGGEPITQADLDRFARDMVESQFGFQRSMIPEADYQKMIDAQLSQYKTDEGKMELLQSYLTSELLYREALASKVEAHSDVARRIKQARRSTLTSAFIDQYMGEHLQLTDSEIENAYNADKEQYIQAEAVRIEAVMAGDDQKAIVDGVLAANGSLEDYLAKGFDGYYERTDTLPIVKDSRSAVAHLFLLEPDQWGGKWFETTDGKWVQFRVVERRDARQKTLEEARGEVAGGLRQQKRQELIQRLQESLRQKYEVVIHQAPPAAASPTPGGAQ